MDPEIPKRQTLSYLVPALSHLVPNPVTPCTQAAAIGASRRPGEARPFCEFASKSRKWNFGVFDKVLHLNFLNNLVTLGPQTKSKQERSFPNFWCKTLLAKISDIQDIWTNWRSPYVLEIEELYSEPNFVEKRYKLRYLLHHSKGKSSDFTIAFVSELQRYQIGFWYMALLLRIWLKSKKLQMLTFDN